MYHPVGYSEYHEHSILHARRLVWLSEVGLRELASVGSPVRGSFVHRHRIAETHVYHGQVRDSTELEGRVLKCLRRLVLG